MVHLLVLVLTQDPLPAPQHYASRNTLLINEIPHMEAPYQGQTKSAEDSGKSRTSLAKLFV